MQFIQIIFNLATIILQFYSIYSNFLHNYLCAYLFLFSAYNFDILYADNNLKNCRYYIIAIIKKSMLLTYSLIILKLFLFNLSAFLNRKIELK